jgi:hypothetical protein
LGEEHDVPLPYDLRQEFLRGNVVLFVGSGLVKRYVQQMPTWQTLLSTVFSYLSNDPQEIFKYATPVFDSNGTRFVHSSEFLKLAQHFELARERVNDERRARNLPTIAGIHQIIQTELSNVYRNADLNHSTQGTEFIAAKTLPLNTWITTNYDTFLEDTVLAEGIETEADVVLSRPVRNIDFTSMAGGGKLLLKIHGCLTHSKPDRSIVITEDDYHQFLRRDSYLVNKLYTLFCEKTVVFLGYSLSDPNIQFIYQNVLFDQKPGEPTSQPSSFAQIRPSFFVSRETNTAEQKAYYRHKRIHYLENYDIEDFFRDLRVTFDVYRSVQNDLVQKLRGDLGSYVAIYEQIDLDTRPDDVGIANELRQDYLSRVLDLIQLTEVYYRSASGAPPLQEFEASRLRRFTFGALQLIKHWCNGEVQRGSTTILQMLLQFIRTGLRYQRSTALNELLTYLVSAFQQADPHTPDLDRLVQRYSAAVNFFDAKYNDWDDYTLCLELYVELTRLFRQLAEPIRRDVVAGLYRQLSVCGRSVGDSWYTTEKVYSVWHRFNADAWPDLEAEIRRAGVTWKDQQMLDHLRPGAEPRNFLPR